MSDKQNHNSVKQSDPATQSKFTDHDNIIIFDTTLRDGEQCPGASMTLEEKLRVAVMLDQLGTDIIEAGFPAASPGDFKAVNTIAKQKLNTVVCGLARATATDIDQAGAAIKPAQRKRIHTFISTSPLHMSHKLKKSPDQVYQMVIDSVTRARKYTDDVEWSAEDGSRSEIDFLCRCVEAAINAGANTINIPDTVGYSLPDEFHALITKIINRVPNADKAIFSVHCHDDLGLAVANSLAGVKGGARQVECTINGIGERAGNAALEEIVMAINTRKDLMPFTTNINTKNLLAASKLVSATTAFPVQYNKAIVGRNAFAHESGIHQDGMIKNAATYEIIRPETVGFKTSNLVMGKHSGRNALGVRLKELGYNLTDEEFKITFDRFKELADKKKHVYDEDIETIANSHLDNSDDYIKLESLTVIAGTIGQKAIITLSIDGQHITHEAEGTGPVDAIFNSIKAIVGKKSDIMSHLSLKLYQVTAVSKGTDAQADVMVALQYNDHISGLAREITGRAADVDTLSASALAYIAAINRFTNRFIASQANPQNLTAKGKGNIKQSDLTTADSLKI